MEERIEHLVGMHIETTMSVADTLAQTIAKASQRLVECLLNDRTILLCGGGGSSANCMHFSNAMLNYFEVERPSLPVHNLSAESLCSSGVGSDHHYAQVFSRQIQAFGKEGDVLVIATTSGNSDALLNALQAAQEKGIDTIALSGRDGGVLASHLGPEDIEVRVACDNAARIRELHLFILHCFCDLIDQSLFSQTLG